MILDNPPVDPERLKLRTHARAFLSRAPLGELLNALADVLPEPTSEARSDIADLRRFAGRPHWWKFPYGTADHLAASLALDAAEGPKDEALDFLEGAKRGDERPVDTVKRLMAVERDHSDLAESMGVPYDRDKPGSLMTAVCHRAALAKEHDAAAHLLDPTGRDENPPRSLTGLVKDLIAKDEQAHLGASAPDREALRTIKAYAQAGESLSHAAIRLVAWAQLAPGDPFFLEVSHDIFKSILASLREVRDGNESAAEVARRLVDHELFKRKIAEHPNYVPAPWRFLKESGLLFELNRVVLHPMGVALALREEKGDWDVVGLWRPADGEGIDFGPEALAEGKATLSAFMAAEGTARHDARFAKLGMVVEGDEDDARLGRNLKRVLAQRGRKDAEPLAQLADLQHDSYLLGEIKTAIAHRAEGETPGETRNPISVVRELLQEAGFAKLWRANLERFAPALTHDIHAIEKLAERAAAGDRNLQIERMTVAILAALLDKKPTTAVSVRFVNSLPVIEIAPAPAG